MGVKYYYQLVFNRPISWGKIAQEALSYTYHEELAIGVRVTAELGTSSLTAVVVGFQQDMDEISRLVKKGVVFKSIEKVIDKTPLINADQIELAKWMASYYLTSWGTCMFTILPSARREVSIEFSKEIISHFNEKTPTLTEDQQMCVKEIIDAYKDENIDMCYLYGITGSGKTEVFLSSIQHMLDQKKQVLFLVPEIALVLQCYPLFCARFGEEKIAVLHSSITDSQRFTEWNRILSEEAKIIVGVRSAVFAPVKNLGMIVIDEEHDSSYKSGSAPRYHARQVAMKRSKQHNALLVMGSATPSLEAWAFKEDAHLKFLELKKRVAGGTLPSIELISLQNTQGCISPLLQKAIQETLDHKRQVLLLMNRRGFSRVYLCSHCGSSVSCPHCSVNLVYHKVGDKTYLACHHCGYQGEVLEACPNCGFVSMGLKGWGTQRVEEEIHRLFPHAHVDRMDSDVAKDKDKGVEVLGKFYRNETQILVGTQMLAKGINFPHLQLVGILFADALLGIPDFRAEERAFSLMTQVAGRAGRFSTDGKVLVQTYDTSSRVFRSVIGNDKNMFFSEEMKRRTQYNLSPHRRLLRLVFRGSNETDVQELSEKMVEAILRTEGNTRLQILGPAPCTIEKLANKFRYHILLVSKSLIFMNKICVEVLKNGIKAKANSKNVYIEIDPDPLNIF